MLRSVFVALLLSFFVLAGCQYPGESITFGSSDGGGGFGDGGGIFELWVRTTTTGPASSVGDHRVVVTFSDTVEADMRIAPNGELRVLQYREVEHDAGWRTVTLAPGSERCIVTSDNPLEAPVSYTVVKKSWYLEFTVVCDQ